MSRAQASGWYRATAAQIASTHGATASMFRKFADRIDAGEADHRLARVIADQREYDEA